MREIGVYDVFDEGGLSADLIAKAVEEPLKKLNISVQAHPGVEGAGSGSLGLDIKVQDQFDHLSQECRKIYREVIAKLKK